MPIRILLVDDHQLFRSGVARLLCDEGDLLVVGEAADGFVAVVVAAAECPVLILMDVSMEGMNGIEATRQILAKCGPTKILFLSMHRDSDIVAAALEAGASGYVLKDSSAGELAQAIRSVGAGHMYLSPAIAGAVVEGYRRHLAERTDAPGTLLTPREREVLQLLAEGQTTAGVAGQLNISGKTVATHRENLMAKLRIDSVSGLTKYAIRIGLTDV